MVERHSRSLFPRIAMSTEVVTRTVAAEPSLPEVHASVAVSRSPLYWRRLLAFVGPGFLISVGYMDPGNWATDIAGGARFGYTLLFVIMLSNLMAILLQSLSLKLGVATGRDLAQLCHESYGRKTSFVLWVLAEVGIAACDLAEVIGSAIALELLFHIPLFYGVLITGLDVLLILLLQRWGFRYVEALVIALIGTIIALFGVADVSFSSGLSAGVSQSRGAFALDRDQQRHALHCDRNPGRDGDAAQSLPALVDRAEPPLQAHGRRQARSHPHGQRGLGLALMIALFVNAAILIVAAAVFYRSGHFEVAAIQDAYKLLSPLLGATWASTIFAIALLASGQNSSITGTLAGQVVMEGFIHIRVSPWLRRLITRSLAIIPTIIVVALMGEEGTEKLLILSQVILSLQLSFAVIPLVMFTGDRKKMGEFVNGRGLQALAWVTAVVIAGLNAWLLVETFRGS